MVKVWNIVAFFIAELVALVCTYLFWIPAMSFVGEMDGLFKPIASVILVMMLIFGDVIGPILVLNDDKLVERLRK